jgi:hypothetical protein
MSEKEKLLDYILSLSEEQIDKIIDRLPQLLSKSDMPAPPDLQ